ncbi:GNAT family acetyltransferase [Aspergillus nomiae NRRL 13137]|uniref:GNAT family acetyltransferase n=1 Tax=Aspergillus nomiae NRRL (strain ATCC 15546 / NRRL 13137 / CBS 260.88 / M93) TaxID=1509407 RepID=A0A0L1IQC4_ASPN3|nr:GNAT family acetyltransferase [Aspergillus nomiae NRRL 13137]KNG81687.1 GNAT family acetyltransferase [Aspergillus nomiae NRRL 13137]
MSTFNPFRSKRLAYRAIEDTPEDEDFIHSIQSDPLSYATSNSTLLKPQTRSDTLNGYKKNLVKDTLLAVIILLPTQNAHDQPGTAGPPQEMWTSIGIIALKKSEPGHGHHRKSSISIDIAKPYQNQGYGSEAIQWAVDWGFRKAGLHRIAVEAFSYNQGATRLYERLGFTFEGRQREAIWYDGDWHDLLTFGMLDREWKGQQQTWKSTEGSSK